MVGRQACSERVERLTSMVARTSVTFERLSSRKSSLSGPSQCLVKRQREAATTTAVVAAPLAQRQRAAARDTIVLVSKSTQTEANDSSRKAAE